MTLEPDVVPAAPRRSRFTFTAVIWLVCLAMVCVIFGMPLVQNLWAYEFWTPTPCYVDVGGNYVYDADHVKYKSDRRDFWDGKNYSVRSDSANELTTEEWQDKYNGICWVNPHDPIQAVLRLDAHKQWNKLGKAAGVSLLLVVAAAIFSWLGKRNSSTRLAR
jgi:hypothetical protein